MIQSLASSFKIQGLVVALELDTITLSGFVGLHSSGRQMGEQRSLVWGANWAMLHVAAGMTGMQDPSKSFGEIVAGIDDQRPIMNLSRARRWAH